MNTNKNIVYSLANKIRTKLLLFIDNEISQKSSIIHKKNLINEELTKLHFEETFFEKNNNQIFTIHFTKTPSTIEHTPYKPKKPFFNENCFCQNFSSRRAFPNRTIEQKIVNCNFIRPVTKNYTTNNSTKNNNNCIIINDNQYFIKTNIKQSSAILIEKKNVEKSEKDEKFLKSLCKSFKKESLKRKKTVNGCKNINFMNNNNNNNDRRNLSIKSKKLLNLQENKRSQNKRYSSKVSDYSKFIIPLVFSNRSSVKRQTTIVKTSRKSPRKTPIKTSRKN